VRDDSAVIYKEIAVSRGTKQPRQGNDRKKKKTQEEMTFRPAIKKGYLVHRRTDMSW